MKRVFLILFLPGLAYAQKKDTVLRYLDERLQLTSADKAAFFGVSVKTPDGHYLLYALYADTTPVIEAVYKDKDLTLRDGKFALYYPKGRLAQQGWFRDNKMEGVWRTYYKNKQLKDSGVMQDNKFAGLWKNWYENGQLMQVCHYPDQAVPSRTGQQIAKADIKDGVFESWYESGKPQSAGQYENDIMTGEWKWYYETGNTSTIEQYTDGKLSAIQCFDSTGKDEGSYCSISKPAVLKQGGDCQAYIRDNLTWPKEALKRKIEGTVHVHLKVSKAGRLEKLDLSCDQEILKKAVADLFDGMKEWYPAVSHNRPIEWEQEFDIPFRRND
jgi:antitoxin component YwqK of YwqJK toxin-antitoxin module